jgi:hypothetical protein
MMMMMMMMRDSQSSCCEDYHLLGCDSVQSGECLPACASPGEFPWNICKH